MSSKKFKSTLDRLVGTFWSNRLFEGLNEWISENGNGGNSGDNSLAIKKAEEALIMAQDAQRETTMALEALEMIRYDVQDAQQDAVQATDMARDAQQDAGRATDMAQDAQAMADQATDMAQDAQAMVTNIQNDAQEGKFNKVTSPNGSRYEIKVSNEGVLTAEKII